MDTPIRVLQYGLGPIGLASVRALVEKQRSGRLTLVGAVDIDPEKAGRTVSELAGVAGADDVVVSDDAGRALADARPDVVVHTTTSFLGAMHAQLAQCARAGAHVVSSTEELSFPFERHPDVSAELDRVAKEHGVVIIGTGVNPGYAMDTLALTATGVSVDVTEVHVERVVDAGKRRLPLQRKVGAGITAEQFAERKKTGTFGHIGLVESLYLLADGLDWPLDRVEETLDPMVAEQRVDTPFLTVEAGQVAGIHHAVTGYQDGHALLSLDLKMYVGAPDARDAVRVVGDPPIDLVVHGGIFGDTATVAALVNTVPLVLDVPAGLRTVKDLPIPRAFATTPSRFGDGRG